jgi:cupin 2 domain-containing protein
LWIEGQEEQDLRPGDHLLIPAHEVHRVTWTATGETTIWLAIHFPA